MQQYSFLLRTKPSLASYWASCPREVSIIKPLTSYGEPQKAAPDHELVNSLITRC